MTPLLLPLAILALPPIQSSEIGPQRSFQVNGQPFLPIMIWLQDPDNWDSAKAAGINTVAGYWPNSGGTTDVVEYAKLVDEAGLYGVLPYDSRLKGHPALLAYIHGDEPDLSHDESDAEVTWSENLRINRSNPLWKILDGTTHTWSVLDPLEGASVTVTLKQPVTITKLGVWLTISGDLAVAKDVVFEADGQPLVTATLQAEKGRQEIPLPQPATFTSLTMKITSTHAGGQVWGSIGELEGFDAAGRNVLLSVPRKVPRATPEATLSEYQTIKQADPTRPVFLTVTGRFMPLFKGWTEDQIVALYPSYAKATDVIGYDIYPIYGWGKPEWIYLVHDATVELTRIAAGKPTYAWIETSAGSQWVGDDHQVPVTPRDIRAEVWMSICGGATAIGYFTHIWKPAYSQFGVPPENVVAMKAINDQLTRLTQAIYAPPTTRKLGLTLADDLRATIVGRELDGQLYLFAVNYDPDQKGGDAKVSVEGLKAGTRIEVIDEDRTITAADGGFTDAFEPLAVHLYRIAL